METYVTGNTIKKLREAKKMTQHDLGSLLNISEQAISKWENGHGFPDSGIIEDLAKALNVSIMELFSGNIVNNHNVVANIKKSCIYACPICGNVLVSIGPLFASCCGRSLEKLSAKEDNSINIEYIDNEIYVSTVNNMNKEEYVSFIIYVTDNSYEFKKLYPEEECIAHFHRLGHGIIYIYYSTGDLEFKRI